MKKSILIILALIVAALVFVALGYALSSMKNEQASSETETFVPDLVADASLAKAINLLPDPTLALGGRKMTDKLYWIWNTTVDGEERQGRVNTTWIVDIDKGEAVETFTRKDIGPMEPTTTFPSRNDDYIEVVWENGWEGFSTEIHDYFDVKTGELAYSLVLNMGQEAIITSGDTELSIMLDPPSGCEDAVTDPSKDEVVVTGLNINGVSYPFEKPQTTTCVLNEMHGSGYYPEFKFITLSSTENIIRLGLPWDGDGAYAELPIPSLDPEQIQYK